jgi:O-acetyl-ADP-ribose deacetylase (regulator of RNase III)
MAVDVASLPTWADVLSSEPDLRAPHPRAAPLLLAHAAGDAAQGLARYVRLFRGDITTLRADAIVNAANNACLGGGGIDGAIHDAAGRGLYDECRALPLLEGAGGGRRTRCRDGEAVITRGHALPARFVIHTVGPRDGDAGVLEACYKSCYALAKARGLRSVVFNCIATGIFGFPNARAAVVALKTVEAEMRRDLAGGRAEAPAAEAEAPAAAAEAEAAAAPAEGGDSGGGGGGGGGGVDAPSGEAAAPAAAAEAAAAAAPLPAEGGGGSGGADEAPEGAAAPQAPAGAAAPAPAPGPSEPLDVTFCVFLEKDLQIYEGLLSHFFPLPA